MYSRRYQKSELLVATRTKGLRYLCPRFPCYFLLRGSIGAEDVSDFRFYLGHRHLLSSFLVIFP